MVSTVINESSRTALECALRCDCSTTNTNFKSAVIRSNRSSCWLISDSLYDMVGNIDIVSAIKTDHSAITVTTIAQHRRGVKRARFLENEHFYVK